MPQRRHPTHGVLSNANQPPIVFLTVCTKDRRPWLADESVHKTLVNAWKQADAWLVGRYVLMPDHLHLFSSPADETFSLEAWVKYWKSRFSRQHGNASHRWQADHWDRRLRSSDSYEAKWLYVRENPVRAGLVADADAWAYQGELNAFRRD